MKSADWYQHHMIQAHNQISHFHALRSASGMDWIPAGRGRGKGYLNPPNPQLLKLFSLRLLRPNTPNLLKPGHRSQSQRKYLRSRAFNVISLSLKFCFRLMLRLGDRVCTRACFLNVSHRFFRVVFQCKLFLQSSVSRGHLDVTWHLIPSYTFPVLCQ